MSYRSASAPSARRARARARVASPATAPVSSRSCSVWPPSGRTRTSLRLLGALALIPIEPTSNARPAGLPDRARGRASTPARETLADRRRRATSRLGRLPPSSKACTPPPLLRVPFAARGVRPARCSRRWSADCRSPARGLARSPRSPATPRCCSIPIPSPRSPRRSSGCSPTRPRPNGLRSAGREPERRRSAGRQPPRQRWRPTPEQKGRRLTADTTAGLSSPQRPAASVTAQPRGVTTSTSVPGRRCASTRRSSRRIRADAPDADPRLGLRLRAGLGSPVARGS